MNVPKEVIELKQFLLDKGYVVRDNSNFFTVEGGQFDGQWGWEVGSFVHSCHVDSSDISVLIIKNGDNIEPVIIWADMQMPVVF